MKKALLLASLIFVTACGATKAGRNSNPLQETEHVILLDRAHKMYLKVVKDKIEKLPSGQMQVTMEMENRRDENIPTDIQVIFRGADGFEVEKTSWTPFQFHRREVNTFQATSMNAAATDYRIIIRKPE